ncbi:hypothetical protein [Amycolatopsis nigrescens]|uniref:hypothetical protein n=1 Tax=Amycolatopsis nigrescens TaxID=381445 RepID=UPI001FE0BCC2|nr:hypothetical protein [Amycolatopsis nigrescens]
MRKRAFLSAVCVAAVVSGVGGLASPAAAFSLTTTVSAVAQVPDRVAADRALVRVYAGKHPYSLVRAAAWSALISSAPDEAVAEFLKSGYAYAVQRSEQNRARNLDFARRVLATHTKEYSPEVHAAAERAVNGTDADREAFARTGYEAAKQLDKQERDASGEQAAAIKQADREYVLALATADPGPQVRASAAWATRPGYTDADIVEFFAYGWASSAKLDLEMHRLHAADANVTWRVTVNRLIVEAQAAEQAAKDAAEEVAEQARAAAARAWQAVGEQTAPARTAWSEAQQVAERQAANWRAVLDAANAAKGPNWDAIVDPATASQADWQAEKDFAVDQARFWEELLQQARDGEQRMNK